MRLKAKRIAQRGFRRIGLGDVVAKCLWTFVPPGGFVKRAFIAFAIFVAVAVMSSIPLDCARDFEFRFRSLVARDYEIEREARKIVSRLSSDRLSAGVRAMRSALRTVGDAVSGLPGETVPVTGGPKSGQPAGSENSREGVAKVGALVRPVEGEISSGFGWRKDPASGRDELHEGMDFAVREGTPVKAAGAGTVKSVREDQRYGKSIEIDHGGGLSTVYAHNSEIHVEKGTRVVQGQVIAKAGRSGKATAPHLHFEVRVNGVAVDPGPWIGLGESIPK